MKTIYCGGAMKTSKSRRRLAWLAAVALSSLAAPPGAVAEIELEILPVNLSADGGVVFTTLGPGFAMPEAQKEETWRCAITSTFEVCADLALIELDKLVSGYNYIFFARPRSADKSSPWIQYIVSSNPVGNFLDQHKEVDFLVSEENLKEPGVLSLPLLTIGAEGRLHVDIGEAPVKLQIGSQETILVKLGNRLEDMDIFVHSDIRMFPGKERLWERPFEVELLMLSGQPADTVRLHRGAYPRNLLKLTLKSSRLRALGASVLPYKKNLESGKGRRVHDRITVQIPYDIQGGEVRVQELDIPIHFQPSLPALFFSVAIGALVGSLIPLFRKQTKWLRSLGLVILLAIVVEAVGLLLVEFNSEFRLLGIVLDPYQMLSAGLIGTFVGLSRFHGLYLITNLAERYRPEEGGKKNGK